MFQRGGPQGILLIVSKGGKKAHRNSAGDIFLGVWNGNGWKDVGVFCVL